MARDRLGSEYSENMSDATTYSCNTNSVEKCSLRSCTEMFNEPFFLHPPGTRPRDGIYINPMSPFISEHQKSKDTESFYLHSPHDLVYTRITRLFCDSVDKTRNSVEHRNGIERKDETVTVKVDVHVNNGSLKSVSNGNSIKSDITKESDHAYEQICVRQDETESIKSGSNKKFSDDASESSRSRTTGRRFSRSSSGSESSSHLSSEIPCYSSTTSTPSLSRKSSNERINKIPKAPEFPERKSSSPEDGEKDSKIIIDGPSIAKPPPPPPPPPPPDNDDIVVTPVRVNNETPVENDTKDNKNESKSITAANKSDTSSEQSQQAQAEVVGVLSATTDFEDAKSNQVSHLVNKHMVLPFIPPQFSNAANSDTLLKPSEYLRSICKSSNKNSLSKARSVDNLDIQGRLEEAEVDKCEEEKVQSPGPPPPPLPPPIIINKDTPINSTASSPTATTSSAQEPETPKSNQPLATISIQDLTSVQLRRTNIKMHATKTFSAPPNRSVSMTNVSESFFVQKTDLIAELKKTKDIPGIKKFKVEMAKVEKTQEQHLISEITKNFSVSSFVDQIPEKDSTGNMIPIWKRQMLARKAAERAKKELEEQIARENEEKRQKAIPPWKRQLLAKKESVEPDKDRKVPVAQLTRVDPPVVAPPPVKIDLIPPLIKKDPPTTTTKHQQQNDEKIENNNNNEDDKKVVSRDHDSDDDAPIIPWRAQLRKTNSKLSILD